MRLIVGYIMKNRILVAEDEQDIQELIEFTLRYGGYDVLHASNGKEALEITQTEQPDLVLMDIRMPVMSGLEACKLIKTNPETKNIPVVFLTAIVREEEASPQASYTKGYSILAKTVTIGELIACIKKNIRM